MSNLSKSIHRALDVARVYKKANHRSMPAEEFLTVLLKDIEQEHILPTLQFGKPVRMWHSFHKVPVPVCKVSVEPKQLLDKDWIRAVLAYGFGWAIKDCIRAAGLPDNPVARREPYAGEQIQRLGIIGKFGMELHIKTEATMRITKARKRSEAKDEDLNSDLAKLIQAAADHCANYFGEPGLLNNIGACNYPDEKTEKIQPLRYKNVLIRTNFRAHTYLDRTQEDPNPGDPMDPTRWLSAEQQPTRLFALLF